MYHEAVLPLPKEEYLKDFASSAGDASDGRADFLKCLERAHVVTQLALSPGGHPDEHPAHHERERARRDKAYADGGSYMLGQIDDAFKMPFYDLYTRQQQRISKNGILNASSI